MKPFDEYPGRGCELLKPPAPGDGTARRGYGLDLMAGTGQTCCAYCGLSLVDTFDHWLMLCVDHVVPVPQAVGMGIPAAFHNDKINMVLCCSACNGFDNRYQVPEEFRKERQFSRLEEFLALRDEVFLDRNRRIAGCRQTERAFFESMPWEALRKAA